MSLIDLPTKLGCNHYLFFIQNNIILIYKKIEVDPGDSNKTR